MTSMPSFVRTAHTHLRLRRSKISSKIGNRSNMSFSPSRENPKENMPPECRLGPTRPSKPSENPRRVRRVTGAKHQAARRRFGYRCRNASRRTRFAISPKIAFLIRIAAPLAASSPRRDQNTQNSSSFCAIMQDSGRLTSRMVEGATRPASNLAARQSARVHPHHSGTWRIAGLSVRIHGRPVAKPKVAAVW